MSEVTYIIIDELAETVRDHDSVKSIEEWFESIKAKHPIGVALSADTIRIGPMPMTPGQVMAAMTKNLTEHERSEMNRHLKEGTLVVECFNRDTVTSDPDKPTLADAIAKKAESFGGLAMWAHKELPPSPQAETYRVVYRCGCEHIERYDSGIMPVHCRIHGQGVNYEQHDKYRGLQAIRNPAPAKVDEPIIIHNGIDQLD